MLTLSVKIFVHFNLPFNDLLMSHACGVEETCPTVGVDVKKQFLRFRRLKNCSNDVNVPAKRRQHQGVPTFRLDNHNYVYFRGDNEYGKNVETLLICLLTVEPCRVALNWFQEMFQFYTDHFSGLWHGPQSPPRINEEHEIIKGNVWKRKRQELQQCEMELEQTDADYL